MGGTIFCFIKHIYLNIHPTTNYKLPNNNNFQYINDDFNHTINCIYNHIYIIDYSILLYDQTMLSYLLTFRIELKKNMNQMFGTS